MDDNPAERTDPLSRLIRWKERLKEAQDMVQYLEDLIYEGDDDDETNL